MPLAFLSQSFFTSPLFNISLKTLRTGHNCRPALSSPSPTPALRSMSASAETPSTEYVTAFTTVPNDEVGTKLASSLVENQLAACVNSIPNVKSTYTWKGVVEHETEILLMIKTRASLVPQVTDMVNKLHPYDVPELIVQRIIAGSPSYLNWIGETTKKAGS